MLSKLMKYDLKSMGKRLIPYYIVLILLALLERGISLITNNLIAVSSDKLAILSMISVPIKIMFFLSAIIILVFTLFISAERFYYNIYKDEGYLTNTLPVTKKAIINSKLLSSIITFLTSVIVLISALFIGIPNFIQIVESVMGVFSEVCGSKLLGTLIFGGLIFLSYINYLVTVYLAIALGHKRNNNKIIASVVYGIIIYIILQFASLISVGVVCIINPNIINELSMDIIPVNAMLQLMSASLILILIFNIIEQVLTIKVVSTKLNLE